MPALILQFADSIARSTHLTSSQWQVAPGALGRFLVVEKRFFDVHELPEPTQCISCFASGSAKYFNSNPPSGSTSSQAGSPMRPE